MGTPGRPSKFTEETKQKVITALRGGNYREVAAQYAGISKTTLRNWLILAQDPSAPPEYVEFLAAVEKAEADAEVADLALIRRAAQDGNWNAAAWVRERKNPERWGKHDRTDIMLGGPDGGPVDIRVGVGADPAAIAALASILANRTLQQQDPLALPIETTGQPGGEEALEAFRIAPGELGEGSPSLNSRGPQEATQPVSGQSVFPDVAEFEERKEEQATFEEITGDLAAEEGWAWDDNPEYDEDYWSDPDGDGDWGGGE